MTMLEHHSNDETVQIHGLRMLSALVHVDGITQQLTKANVLELCLRDLIRFSASPQLLTQVARLWTSIVVKSRQAGRGMSSNNLMATLLAMLPRHKHDTEVILSIMVLWNAMSSLRPVPIAFDVTSVRLMIDQILDVHPTHEEIQKIGKLVLSSTTSDKASKKLNSEQPRAHKPTNQHILFEQ